MIALRGIPASPGVAIGPVWLHQKVQLAAYEEQSRLAAEVETSVLAPLCWRLELSWTGCMTKQYGRPVRPPLKSSISTK